MNKRAKFAIAAGGVVTVIAAGTGVGVAASGNDDRPLTGTDLEAATQAALGHSGGGTVLETEVGADGAAYGVEIRLDDGRVAEVSLDAEYHVIGSVGDEDGEAGTDD